MFDAIIAGSGPAGSFAAWGLRGRNVLVLDVGFRPPGLPRIAGNLFEARRSTPDLFDDLIGSEFQSLRNLYQRPVSLKLKAPFMDYIIRDWEKLSPLVSRNFEAVMSFAQGGLANAWGAGAYRFTPRDLEGFPISLQDLSPFYDAVSREIGISGANDDLAPYFGHEPELLPPLRLSRFARGILDAYSKRRDWFHRRGIAIGLPRLAVLTEPRDGRAAYNYDNLEFFRPHNTAIYNPAFTLDKLVSAGEVEYRSGWLVTRYEEDDTGVTVHARRVDSGETAAFRARHLLLAAGALNSAKLALASHRDTETRLPVLDNPMGCIPLFRPGRIGAALEIADSSMAQLNLIYRDETGETLQATVYGATGPLRSDVLFQFPLSVKANCIWAKYLAPAMALVMLFYPGTPAPGNYLKLRESGELEVNYETAPLGAVEARIIRAFRKIGYWGHTAFCQYPRIGSSLHYAGMLPMQVRPGPYQTAPDGRLGNSRRVYVVDGAAFTRLPAKNLTFTIMANALRVAEGIRRRL